MTPEEIRAMAHGLRETPPAAPPPPGWSFDAGLSPRVFGLGLAWEHDDKSINLLAGPFYFWISFKGE